MPPTRRPRRAPPDWEPERLARLVARRSAARLRRVARILGRRAAAPEAPRARRLLRAAGAAIGRLPGPERIGVLNGPDLRGFLGEAETWTEALRLADAARGGSRGRAAATRLFDRISRTAYLTVLLPAGRIDRGFPGRARRLARLRLRAALDDLAAFAAGLRLAHPGGPPPRLLSHRSLRLPRRLALRLRRREEPEQGRPADRVDLGMVSGPGGAFAIACGRLVRRPTIPGSPILLAPVVLSRPRSLRVGRPDPALGPRFAAALRLLEAAWPEARAMVLRHTVMVVPVREPGTVSWSLAARPGVSFINPYGKTILDLADDLVHESAHHRLHDLQEARRLLRPGPETEEVQAFDSPWRGARRPLHGILHGFFTFLHRLELLIRVREEARARPGALRPYLKGTPAAFITEEIRKERRMVLASLADLRRAARAGLLTAGGRKFLGSLAARAARLNASPRPPRAGRAPGRAGGRERSRTRRRARRR